MQKTYLLLADAVLITHALFVVFVVFGLVFVVVGGFRGWRWARNRWFRFIHLAGIGIVVVQAWLGIICPLTTLEMWLRQRGGGNLYSGGFIQHWVSNLLYYQLPLWAFAVIYTAFAALVVLAWWRFPPRRAA